MPKAAVHEDGNLRRRKNEVRFPKERVASAPAAHSFPAKCRNQAELGGPVALGLNLRHDPGALAAAEGVHNAVSRRNDFRIVCF